LGADSNTYYVTKATNFHKNYLAIQRVIEEQGVVAVAEIVAISTEGRAPKQDASLFALALAATSSNPLIRKAAIAGIQHVCRIPTHLFSFLSDYKALGGKTGGSQMKKALAAWYTRQQPRDLAYQVVKYRQRTGWEHRDVLRLCRPAGFTTGEATPAGEMGDILAFAAGKPVKGSGPHLNLVKAFEELQAISDTSAKASVQKVVTAIRKLGLPREAVPEAFLKSAEVWEALLMPGEGSKHGMPLTALIRSLNRMTIAGLLSYNSEGTRHVVARVTDAKAIKQARVHPIQLLSASRTYAQGKGEKGSLTWSPNPQVVAALEQGFLYAFDAVPKTDKRYYIGLDISSSMDGNVIAGVPGLTARDASVCMAMLWARTEPFCVVKGFSSSYSGNRNGQSSDGLTDFTSIFKTENRATCVRKVQDCDFGSTQPDLIINNALRKKIEVDVFIVMTDNEVNQGTHVFQALQQYRKAMRINAKMVVIGMTATDFTLADPNDPGMMDVVGFDSAAPSIIAEFVNR
jgi:60 kDa SS-A/Ro ribonucleoprotein